MVSPDSRLGTVGIYIQYITKIVVLVSEPVRGRSRATELPCSAIILHLGSSGGIVGNRQVNAVLGGYSSIFR